MVRGSDRVFKRHVKRDVSREYRFGSLLGKFPRPEYPSLNAGRSREELLARGEDANVGLAAASVDACVLGGVASSSSGRSSIVCCCWCLWWSSKSTWQWSDLSCRCCSASATCQCCLSLRVVNAGLALRVSAVCIAAGSVAAVGVSASSVAAVGVSAGSVTTVGDVRRIVRVRVGRVIVVVGLIDVVLGVVHITRNVCLMDVVLRVCLVSAMLVCWMLLVVDVWLVL